MNHRQAREFMRAERRFEKSKKKIQKYIRLAEAWSAIMQEAIDTQNRLVHGNNRGKTEKSEGVMPYDRD